MKEDLSLYIHIPFCKKRCPYCHFYTVKNDKDLHISLQNAIISQIEQDLPRIQSSRLVSIYFGGGTPSVVDPSFLEAILNKLPLSPEMEITIEVNPEDVTLEKITAYKKMGINRVSMGVQSLESTLLKKIGRHHNPSISLEAIWTIQKAGIDNLSIDLMIDLPSETIEKVEATLSKLKDLPISHLSLYNMTLEEEALFFRIQDKIRAQMPLAKEGAEILDKALTMLSEIGFSRYEISAFAKEGKSSIHNLGYWKGRSFLGYGPSAFSYDEGRRFRRVQNLETYIKEVSQGNSAIDFEEKLSYPDNMLELLVIGLRPLEGLDIAKFDLPQETLEKIATLIEDGYLIKDHTHLRLSERGVLFYDSVAEELI